MGQNAIWFLTFLCVKVTFFTILCLESGATFLVVPRFLEGERERASSEVRCRLAASPRGGCTVATVFIYAPRERLASHQLSRERHSGDVISVPNIRWNYWIRQSTHKKSDLSQVTVRLSDISLPRPAVPADVLPAAACMHPDRRTILTTTVAP